MGKVIKTTNRKKIVKYILCEIEKHISSSDIDYLTTDATIEHILPETFNSAWGVTQSDHESNVYRLGNYTLLEKSRNKEVGGKKFNEKKKIYSKSRFKLTTDIAEEYSTQWPIEKIENRQRVLAPLATRIWKIDILRG